MENQLILIEDLGMLYPAETSKKKYRYGLYKCMCGNEFEAIIKNVKNGNTSSCGCYNKRTTTKHGLANHMLYKIWNSMLQRCNNPKDKRYNDYAGRGISICSEWLDINNFINDMYPSFKEGLSIDRINNDGNYEPSNCRWVKRTIQSRNTRKLISTNTSGYRGVGWHKSSNAWRAQITINHKNIHLGNFKDVIDAAKAYDQYVIDNNLEHTKNFEYPQLVKKSDDKKLIERLNK